KTVTFTPHGAEVRTLLEPFSLVTQGIVDHSSRLYHFEGFDDTFSIGTRLVSHSDSE
ncbi:hypothetical protein KI387_009123, partial [Taxus chinensis]